MDITTLFCEIDDFCKENVKNNTEYKLLTQGNKLFRNRNNKMTISEIMTIAIIFHESGYRNFKNFYLEHISKHMKKEFPTLLSYNRFVEIMPKIMEGGESLLRYTFLFTLLGTLTHPSFH